MALPVGGDRPHKRVGALTVALHAKREPWLWPAGALTAVPGSLDC